MAGIEHETWELAAYLKRNENKFLRFDASEDCDVIDRSSLQRSLIAYLCDIGARIVKD